MNNPIVKNNRTYVLSEPDQSDRNVFCYEADRLVWQIEEPPKLHARNYFTSIYLSDNNLCAYSINGVEVILDRQTGKFLSSELIK